MYFEPPFMSSYSAVMFNQTLFRRLRWERLEASLLRRGEKRSYSSDGDFNSPECKITTALPMPVGAVLMTAHKDWLHPPRLRLPFMIRGRAIQTVSSGKQVRGFAQRHLPTQQLLVQFQPWGLACSYLANKSKVL